MTMLATESPCPSFLHFPQYSPILLGKKSLSLPAGSARPFTFTMRRKITERLSDLAAFDVVRYAQKACSNLAILDLVRRHGGLVDCVSAGEVHRAMAAGFKPGQKRIPPEIVYTADIFDREALDFVVEHDIHVNCGSPDMIDQYGERARRARIGSRLRINPGFGHGHSQKVNTGGAQSKHGIWHEQLEECIERAQKWNLSITGLHMHIGSGTDLAHLSQVCDRDGKGGLGSRLIDPFDQRRRRAAGPISRRAGVSSISARISRFGMPPRHRLATEFGHEISLEIEPGRYLGRRKRLSDQRNPARSKRPARTRSTWWTPASTTWPARFCTARTTPWQSARPASEASRVVLDPDPCGKSSLAAHCANRATSSPRKKAAFVARRALPEAKVGDFLVIGYAGAYGYVMASNYNSKPLVAEVLIENGRTEPGPPPAIVGRPYPRRIDIARLVSLRLDGLSR